MAARPHAWARAARRTHAAGLPVLLTFIVVHSQRLQPELGTQRTVNTHVRADTSHATRTQAYRVSDSHRGISCTVVSADADGDAGARRTRSGKASASRRTRVAAATYLDSSTESEMSFALESPARAHWGLAAVQNHGIGRLTGVD